MDGVIVLNKPLGKTSHDMVSFIRRLIGVKKVGHTGTLDPYAGGVLPICIGRATKAADMLTATDKRYRAELILGKTTDTQDAHGKVLSESSVDVTDDLICDRIKSFVGDIEQIPPMYSAIKKDGRKLYELAREGIEIEREARKIKIYSIDVEEIRRSDAVSIVIDVFCSKGTYIRTLCEDIGKSLGTGAYMNALTRTASGNFCIEKSYTCEELTEMHCKGEIDRALIKVDNLFEYDKITVKDIQAKRLKDGVRISADGICEGEMYRVYDTRDGFLSISECREGRLVLKKAFWN
ncbi:MAG: tRNA pseudouridine(55) synthase TruB [Oscillospiraceae bacterium]|nr:tRNA pseudouridine(55) synthase TruB [Oscillospiraceae bacterium]